MAHPGGRPTKFTPEIRDRIVQAVSAGNYLETASAFAGVSKDTFYRWLKRGARAKSGKYRQFSDAIEKALATAEVRDVTIIAKAADGYDVTRTKDTVGQAGSTSETVRTREFAWQAAAWRLERKFPDRWGRRERLTAEVKSESKVEHSGTIEVTQAVDDPARLGTIAGLLHQLGFLPDGRAAALAGGGAPAAADALHSPHPNGEADGLPPAARP